MTRHHMDDDGIEALLADLDVVVWEADPRSLAFRYVSPASERVLGRPAQALLADPQAFAELVHPDDRAGVMAALLATDAGPATDVTHRVETSTAEPRWIRTTATAVAVGDERVLRGTCIDVTAGHAELVAHTDAEERFRKVVERLPVIVYLEAAEPPSADGGEGSWEPGSLLYVSPQLLDMLGFRPEEWIADPTAWARQFHPDDVEAAREEYRRVAHGERPFVAEYRMLAADGRVVWIHDEATLIKGDDGTPLFWQGIMSDVTVRHDESDRVAEAEDRYRTLVEQLPAIVYSENVTGDGLQVVYINARVAELLGITPEEWVEDPGVWQRSIHPDDVGAVMAENERSEAAGDPFEIEYRMVARDGRIVWFHDVARLVRRADGEPAYWQGVMTDITSRKEAERRVVEAEGAADELREANEIKDVFLQAVSHDLRGPIAAILGLASTLERPELSLSDDDARDLASRIVSNARKLDRIVSDLLDLDRLERGVLTATFVPTDIGAVVRELVAGADVVAGRRLDLDTAPLTMPADVVMVERIVDNLLRNAVRHTPGDSRIWVRVERMDDGALITVEDDGPGVAPEDRARIFEAFHQGARPGLDRGVGVGLAVVARFAALHGGRAWVEERSGGGASFRVFLSGAADLRKTPAGALP